MSKISENILFCFVELVLGFCFQREDKEKGLIKPLERENKE
jgi:hypothetical protein